mmetsp:Transcript_16086/g.36189  ORF Transcript_16086/g.36189 Transcript_16086/m.36189 type:complete len:201 (+) Transcript_16086:81-683(+)
MKVMLETVANTLVQATICSFLVFTTPKYHYIQLLLFYSRAEHSRVALLGIFHEVVRSKAVVHKTVWNRFHFSAILRPRSFLFLTLLFIKDVYAFPWTTLFTLHLTSHLDGFFLCAIFVDFPVTDDAFHILLADQGVPIFNLGLVLKRNPFSLLVPHVGVVRRELDLFFYSEASDPLEGVLDEDVAFAKTIVRARFLTFSS